jgi:dTDP-glucose pyrophosphorylase
LGFITQIKEIKCQSCVKSSITETEEEIKALVGKPKDAYSHKKLLALYWLKTQTVETVSSIAVQLGKHRTTAFSMVV